MNGVALQKELEKTNNCNFEARYLIYQTMQFWHSAGHKVSKFACVLEYASILNLFTRNLDLYQSGNPNHFIFQSPYKTLLVFFLVNLLYIKQSLELLNIFKNDIGFTENHITCIHKEFLIKFSSNTCNFHNKQITNMYLHQKIYKQLSH